MKQLVVFFKNVDSHAYKDPGPQLQKVLSFRKELEQTKKHLFMQFSSLEVFQGQLRKFLAEWLIEQETRQREMPEQEHVEILKGGLPVWNTWRANHRESVPNLVRADLRGQYLSGFNLEGADLSRADLTGADLTGAKLSQAILREALLANANLFRAEMLGADLHNAVFVNSHLSEANLRGARLKLTTVASTDLSSTVGLESVLHDGPSTIGLDTVYKSQGRIPLSFLRGAGTPENFIEYMRSLTGSAFEYYSCFIAYSTWDQAFADRLYADLQSRGIRCWFAPHDIVAGSKLSPQIDEAIRFYEKVLLILSDHSIRSSWLRFEIKTAIERETQTGEPVLFPIRLVPYEPLAQWKWIDADTGTDLARELRQYFIADFSDWKDHDSYVKSFDRLLRDLRR
ncbi:MAG TPA: toll/interleukin-1 receptor domain-containing protein [Candidatus Angelobacter sp.]|nr:toll/interleukin-1 receptor domain-containing protein [Candidatus Angelobacter sp.]